MDYCALGERVRHWRQHRRLTQEQLAEKTGISSSYLGHIERGTRIASVSTMMALCSALGVTPNDLLGVHHPMEEREETEHLIGLLQELLRYFHERV